MNRASSATGWVRNPVMKSPDLDPTQASSYELGWTFNPISGCLNSCSYCYARKLAHGRLKKVYTALRDGKPKGLVPDYVKDSDRLKIASLDPFYPRFWAERLEELRSLSPSKLTPKGVFVCDMSDLFGIGIPKDWTDTIMRILRRNRQYRFYLLTKQPQNLAKFSPFPDNCWVGVSVTDGKMADDAGYYLEEIQAKVKFLSLEPLQERIQIYFGKPGISWVILGSQTKPTVYPKIGWVKEIVEAADRAGIKVFFKDNIRPLLVDALAVGQIERDQYFVQTTEGWGVRQEMPTL